MATFDWQDTENKVISLVAEILHVDKSSINAESTFDALGADSLDRLELIMKFEEAFGIEINDEEAAHITSINQAVSKINELRTK